MDTPPLDDLVRLLLDPSRAMTVNCKTPITDRIHDGKFIAATPLAMTLYGVDSAAQLSARWRSFTEPLPYLQAAKLVSHARLRHDGVPDTYVTMLQRPGRIPEAIPVVKHTTHIPLGGEDAWVTELWPTELYPRAGEVPTVLRCAAPWRHLAREVWSGVLFLAECDRLFQDHQNEYLEFFLAILSDDRIGSILPEQVLSREKARMAETVEIPIGGTVRLPEAVGKSVVRPYMHWCAVCNEFFTSEDGRPPRCRRCQRKAWNDLVAAPLARRQLLAKRLRQGQQSSYEDTET